MFCLLVPGSKRRHSEEDGVQDQAIDLEAAGDGEFFPSLSERVKRRRRQITYKEGDSDEGEEGSGDEFRPSKTRKKRQKDPDFMAVDDDNDEPDLMSPRGSGDRCSKADVAAALAEGE